MHGLRNNFRGLGRLMAGWLLLWFVAMAAVPPALPAPAATTHEAHAGHATHDAHAANEAHDAHAAGSPAHCPLCLHAAAPPQAAPAQPLPGDAPGLQVAAMDSAALRVRSDAPPPGRGPPAFS